MTRLADAKEVAKVVGISLRTARRWDVEGRLPKPIRIGSVVRWNISELEKWIEASCPPRQRWQVMKGAAKRRKLKRWPRLVCPGLKVAMTQNL